MCGGGNEEEEYSTWVLYIAICIRDDPQPNGLQCMKHVYYSALLNGEREGGEGEGGKGRGRIAYHTCNIYTYGTLAEIASRREGWGRVVGIG